MKKSKSPERSSRDFKNNPFKSLKSFAPKPAPAGEKTAPANTQRDVDTEDDASLFFRAIEGAKRIGDVQGPVPAARGAAEKADPGVQEDERLFLQTMRKIGTAFRNAAPEGENESPGRRSSTSRMRQLKRGTIRISEELDLHGYLRDEALKRLEHFIVNAFSRGRNAVLVITGKGTNSPEGPVLPGAVAAWLREKGKGMVAEFSQAPRDRGGSGAFVVFLKKK